MCVYVYIYMYMRWSTNIQFHIDGMQEFESNSNEEKKSVNFQGKSFKKRWLNYCENGMSFEKKMHAISGNLWALQHKLSG